MDIVGGGGPHTGLQVESQKQVCLTQSPNLKLALRGAQDMVRGLPASG